jgi:hypothetical protein
MIINKDKRIDLLDIVSQVFILMMHPAVTAAANA